MSDDVSVPAPRFRTVKDGFLILLVAAFGCVGAAASYLSGFATAVKKPEEVEWLSSLFPQIGIGGITGIVFVFLISNTDRSDLPRLVSIALVAGFAWRPIADSIMAYPKIVQVQKDSVAALESKANQVEQALERQDSTEINESFRTLSEELTILSDILPEKETRRFDELLQDYNSRAQDLGVQVPDPPAVIQWPDGN